MEIKDCALIIFDLDGTLLDTSEDIFRAIEHAFLKNKVSLPDQKAALPAIWGPASRYVGELLGEEKRRLLPEVLSDFTEYYALHCEERTVPYEGVPELLAALKEAGIFLAVATAKTHAPAARILKKHGLYTYIEKIIGDDDVKNPKPAPDCVLAALEALKVLPGRALFVGDTPPDIVTGRAAGVATCAALWGFGGREALCAEHPTFFAGRVTDLKRLIL